MSKSFLIVAAVATFLGCEKEPTRVEIGNNQNIVATEELEAPKAPPKVDEEQIAIDTWHRHVKAAMVEADKLSKMGIVCALYSREGEAKCQRVSVVAPDAVKRDKSNERP